MSGQSHPLLVELVFTMHLHLLPRGPVFQSMSFPVNPFACILHTLSSRLLSQVLAAGAFSRCYKPGSTLITFER